jgi:hypothetical protein
VQTTILLFYKFQLVLTCGVTSLYLVPFNYYSKKVVEWILFMYMCTN